MHTKDAVFREHLSSWLKARGHKKARGEIARYIVLSTKCHPKSVARTFKRLQLCDKEGIDLSRSEPYKKNDNMCVEERNGHVIRRYLGWNRLDDLALLPLVETLCDTVTLYVNHWKAVRRMVTKERVGAKYVRTYEHRAMTPYARVLAREDVTQEAKETLRAAHELLNPLLLLRKIATLQKQIYQHQKGSRDRVGF
jgi:hypothetical protein